MGKFKHTETFFSKGKEQINNGEFTIRPCKACHKRFMIGKYYSNYCEECSKLPSNERELLESKNKRKKRAIKFCSAGSMSNK